MSARDAPLPMLSTDALLRPWEYPGVCVGTLVALSEHGAAIRIGANSPAPPMIARSVIELTEEDIGCELVVVFECGDRTRPIILGRIRIGCASTESPIRVTTDGERVVVRAREQLVLQCGEATLTLTRSGKVLIRGHYVQSRATGVNSIKGGSVELN